MLDFVLIELGGTLGEKFVDGRHRLARARHREDAVNRHPAFSLQTEKAADRKGFGAERNGQCGLDLDAVIRRARLLRQCKRPIGSGLIEFFDRQMQRPVDIVERITAHRDEFRSILQAAQDRTRTRRHVAQHGHAFAQIDLGHRPVLQRVHAEAFHGQAEARDIHNRRRHIGQRTEGERGETDTLGNTLYSERQFRLDPEGPGIAQEQAGQIGSVVAVERRRRAPHRRRPGPDDAAIGENHFETEDRVHAAGHILRGGTANG